MEAARFLRDLSASLRVRSARSSHDARMRTTLRPLTLPLLIVLAGSALVGCGAASAGGSRVATLGSTVAAAKASDTTVPKDPRQASLAFAKCMREHGVHMPDPSPSDKGGFTVQVGGDEQDHTLIDRAQKACQRYLDAMVGTMKRPDPREEAKMRQQMLAYAQCMRDHGVAFPDPKFSDNGLVQMGRPGLNPKDPKFAAADKACQKDLPKPSGAITSHKP
jgi:hypothetical protein